MGKQKKTRKFAEVRARASTIELPHPPPSPHTLQVKRMISPKDERLNFKEKGAAPAPQPAKTKRLLHLPPKLPPCRNRSCRQPSIIFVTCNLQLFPSHLNLQLFSSLHLQANPRPKSA
jgi:hypothetical protein